MAPKDARFASVQSDPRFRKPKQSKLKVELDDRFKSILDDGKVGGKGDKAKTDKYGRKVTATHNRDQLRKFYRLGQDDKLEEKSEAGVPSGSDAPFIDYARGEGLLESSGDEDSDASSDDEEEEEEEAFVELGAGRSKPKKKRSDSMSSSDLEVDLNEDEDETDPAALARLEAQAAKYAQEEEEYENAEPTTTEKTNRLAVVNLDWDHVHATDLYKVFSSVLAGRDGNTARGKIVDVKVYPSEFGKERMEREAIEGPPPELFMSNKRKFKSKKREVIEDEMEEMEDMESMEDDGVDEEGADTESVDGEGDLEVSDEEEVDELEDDQEFDDASSLVEEDEGEDVDQDKLRSYQLERLRYYYAVATFSSPDAAGYIHSECDGTEFERTANILDLRYVPDEMTFDDEPRDEANEDPKIYKGLDFVTDALRNSSVKLTWDDDAPSRVAVTRRKLSRKEIDEQDFSAFLASDSESEDEDARSNLRQLLLGNIGSLDRDTADGFGGASDDDEEGKGAGGMEITFAPGLSERTSAEIDPNETSLEAYKRKMRDRRKAEKEKREKARAEKNGGSKEDEDKESEDEFFGGSSDEEEAPKKASKGDKKNGKKPSTRSTEDDQPTETTAAHLDLLTLPTPSTNPLAIDDSKHFSMTDIIKEEKNAGAGKKRKRAPHKKTKTAEMREKDKELGDTGFEINVKDERFNKLNVDHRFAIDPSHPQFKKTKAMSKLLEERNNLRATQVPSETVPGAASKPVSSSNKDTELESLVASVKRKAGSAQSNGKGADAEGKKKRRRR
ncbi:Uncharacterized conserved protein [Phaffia rhodozyma]|uniref:Uncharacterized conserved protein n=1 Tax=Phaffia rhodozyma TaxID=264483 RepID=A0A0F7SLR1_PHARH|nr:Uncharacterized conserved protein [Phaffia rhodozyma]